MPERLKTQAGPIRAAVLLVIVLAVFASSSETFLTSFNVQTLFAFAVPAALVAIGQTIVMIEGEIDLSVAATAVLAGIVMVKLEPSGLAVALAGGLGVGLAVGLFNGVLTAYVGIVSLISSLASLFVAQGLAYSLADRPISGTRLDLAIKLDEHLIWVLTPRLILGILVLAVVQVALTRTALGRTVFARGADARAAGLLGLPARRAVMVGFATSGVLAAAAGIVLAFALNSASPVIGGDLLLLGIAAALIGGASLSGGSGSVLGAVLALVALVALANGMDKLQITPYVQTMVRGGVVLIALLLAGRDDGGVAQLQRARMLLDRLRPAGRGAAPPHGG